MSSSLRILVLGDGLPSPNFAGAEVDAVSEFSEALQKLATGQFAGLFAEQSSLEEHFASILREKTILQFADRGICFLDPEGAIVWANPIFRSWCQNDPVGLPFLLSFGTHVPLVDHPDPIGTVRSGESVTFRLQRPNTTHAHYLEVVLHPIRSPQGSAQQLIALCRNITPEVEQQKKLDALHRAGRDLASLTTTDLDAMSYPDRVELLRHNIRRTIHDLLHYDVIELRLLDRTTQELIPLLSEGMTPEAASRKLFARPTHNGVTGYVAHSGTSYLCDDAAHDPHYILGAAGARSSMTVPLIYDDTVVGTLNVESPRINGFGHQDLQFTELFSREIASALHTLDLLSAQQNCSVAATIDAIQREIALPVDDVLASAQLLSSRLAGSDSESLIRKMVESVRLVKEQVSKVGREMGMQASTKVGPLATIPDPPLRHKRILVVDGDERMRRQAHLVMGRLGAIVETTGTAEEGLAMAAGSAYDTIFMDIRPPDLGGYETYRRLRDACPGVQVAMTTGFGYDSGHAIVKARQDGMQFVLFKPYRPDQVIRAVLTPALPRGTTAPGSNSTNGTVAPVGGAY